MIWTNIENFSEGLSNANYLWILVSRNRLHGRGRMRMHTSKDSDWASPVGECKNKFKNQSSGTKMELIRTTIWKSKVNKVWENTNKLNKTKIRKTNQTKQKKSSPVEKLAGPPIQRRAWDQQDTSHLRRVAVHRRASSCIRTSKFGNEPSSLWSFFFVLKNILHKGAIHIAWIIRNISMHKLGEAIHIALIRKKLRKISLHKVKQSTLH